MMLVRLVLVLLLLSGVSTAQDASEKKKSLELPECDIFLFDLDISGEMKIKNGRNITQRPGYDNQPWFTPNGKSILFSANRKPDRTDVFEYFIDAKEIKQVTDSATQEYSPQISPDNQTLSFVTDGDSANQSVWRQKRDGSKLEWLMKNQGEREPVGYYSWNHETGYILFWSRYGFSMRLIHESKKVSHYVTGNAVPTTPYIIPGTKNFSFVHQQGNGEVWIKALNPETRAVRPLVQITGSNRNYGWTPDGQIVMCDGSKLMRWSPKKSSDDSKPTAFSEIADLSEYGMKQVTRVAVSPDGKHIAIVGMPK